MKAIALALLAVAIALPAHAQPKGGRISGGVPRDLEIHHAAAGCDRN